MRKCYFCPPKVTVKWSGLTLRWQWCFGRSTLCCSPLHDHWINFSVFEGARVVVKFSWALGLLARIWIHQVVPWCCLTFELAHGLPLKNKTNKTVHVSCTIPWFQSHGIMRMLFPDFPKKPNTFQLQLHTINLHITIMISMYSNLGLQYVFNALVFILFKLSLVFSDFLLPIQTSWTSQERYASQWSQAVSRHAVAASSICVLAVEGSLVSVLWDRSCLICRLSKRAANTIKQRKQFHKLSVLWDTVVYWVAPFSCAQGYFCQCSLKVP